MGRSGRYWTESEVMQPSVMSSDMDTIRLGADDAGVAAAARLLGAGKLVAIPTETVYGLAADARNPEAVAGIYRAKDRPAHNPLIVHVSDLAMARKFAHFTDAAEALAAAFWPGPLTLVLPLRKDAGLAQAVTAGHSRVALRSPDHPAAQAVLAAFGGPLAAPSANPSGRISPTSADHVLDPAAGLGGRIAAVLDAGPAAVGVESTIIGWDEDDKPLILRPGGLAADRIAAVLGQMPGAATGQETGQNPPAPGMLASHYAPDMPLRLNAATPLPGETWISFGAGENGLNLSQTGDLAEAAGNLFATLRKADALGLPIAVAPIPMRGLGVAINDRLARAAAPRPVAKT